ncbi:alpha/beta-hydrolase, partial [Meira miltonrushii]
MAPSFDCCIKANYHTGKPVGHETKFAGLDTYITGSESADKAILIIPDVFGITLVNTRLLADKYAESVGARVYVPDFFDGQDLQKQSETTPNFDRSKAVPELIKNFPPRNYERFPPVVDEIRKAQPSAKKIGSIGFCWGAGGSVKLGSKEAGSSQVDAVAFAHPSLIESTDFQNLEKPGLFMCCQHDPMFPKDKQEASKLEWEKLAEKGVFIRQSYYPFVSHGWAIKGDETNPYSAKAM